MNSFTDCAIPAYHKPGRTHLNESSARRRGRHPHNTQQTQETKKACPQWDSNSRSQKPSGCRPTPLPTRPQGLAHLNIILPCEPTLTYPPINLTPSGFVTLCMHVIASIRSVCSAHPRFNNHNIQSMKPLIQFYPSSCYLFYLGFSYSVNPTPQVTVDNLSEF